MDALTPKGASLAARVDRHVGEKIRRRRVLMGFTQEHLAEALEISYQQIQKYETGANRVSAGRLYQIARHLDVVVSHFFEGLDNETGDELIIDQPSSRVTIELVRNFSAISENSVRASVVQLVKSLSDAEDEDAEPDHMRVWRAGGVSEGNDSPSDRGENEF
ncbi:MAG: helix-turn-helix transcriptional regulator [Pseudomonadota bacterium]